MNMRFNKYWKFIGLLILLFAFLALMDIKTIPIWGTESVQLFADTFWTFGLFIAIIVALAWYIKTGDKSESISFVIGYEILKWTGLEDLFFYIFKGFEQSMPHLFAHPIIGKVASIMGLETVTPFSLLVSVSIGIILTYIIVKKLKKM